MAILVKSLKGAYKNSLLAQFFLLISSPVE